MLSAAQVRERALALRGADPETTLTWAVDTFPGKATLTDPGPLYQTDPDRCCAIRKVEPLARAIAGFDAWISAVRQDQSSTRSATEVVEYHEIDGRPIVKVFPLAHWTRADLWRYIRENGVSYHPLLDQGYSSIGCWPCTRPTTPGEAERAGRWSGTGKTECGLHTFTIKQEV